MHRLQLPVGSVLVWLILDGLTVYRLTRLMTRDTITDGWRSWLTSRYTGGWMVELLMCGWCLSVWFAATAAVLTWLYPAVWVWCALGASAAAVGGLVLARLDR